MTKRPTLEMVQISISVPRGEAGYWSIIRDLDRAGPWTVRQICARTNVKTQAVGRYVRQLRLAGIAQIVETKKACGDNLPAALSYRLNKRPLIAPRLTLEGQVKPESALDQLWRAMKMAKVFSLADMADHCPDIPRETAKRYLSQLAAAGVVVGTPSRYRLARNLGNQAPKILNTKLVYDPNSKSVIGPSITTEAKP